MWTTWFWVSSFASGQDVVEPTTTAGCVPSADTKGLEAGLEVSGEDVLVWANLPEEAETYTVWVTLIGSNQELRWGQSTARDELAVVSFSGLFELAEGETREISLRVIAMDWSGNEVSRVRLPSLRASSVESGFALAPLPVPVEVVNAQGEVVVELNAAGGAR